MRAMVNRVSDRLLGLVAPRAVAQARYCLACELTGERCINPNYHVWNCLTRTNGWVKVYCYQDCP
jgi:hypothetical protein